MQVLLTKILSKKLSTRMIFSRLPKNHTCPTPRQNLERCFFSAPCRSVICLIRVCGIPQRVVCDMTDLYMSNAQVAFVLNFSFLRSSRRRICNISGNEQCLYIHVYHHSYCMNSVYVICVYLIIFIFHVFIALVACSCNKQWCMCTEETRQNVLHDTYTHTHKHTHTH